MASNKHQEQDPIEAFYKEKITLWTAALETYRSAKASDGGADLGAASTGGHRSGAAVPLPVGVFRDKGVKEAVVVYLEATRRKQTNKEIANGLITGGIATTSANFEATVGTALLRLKNEGVVLRFPDGWDLSASYPESLRNRLEGSASPKKAKRGKRSKKTAADEPRAKAEKRSAPLRAIHIRDEADVSVAS